MAFLAPAAAGLIPTVLGGISGRRAATRGLPPLRGPGRLGLEETLGRLGQGAPGREFAGEILDAPLVRQAAATGQRQRLRIGQQSPGLSRAQTASLFQRSGQGLAGNLLGSRLRAGVARAEATQRERLQREQREFQASLFAEQLAREREEERLRLELGQESLGREIAGSGAELGLGLAGGILGIQERRRQNELLFGGGGGGGGNTRPTGLNIGGVPPANDPLAAAFR